jgi:hypothetical protein
MTDAKKRWFCSVGAEHPTVQKSKNSVYHEGGPEEQHSSDDCRVLTLMQKVETLERVLTENGAQDDVSEMFAQDDFVKLESDVEELMRRADEMDVSVKSTDAINTSPSRGANAPDVSVAFA